MTDGPDQTPEPAQTPDPAPAPTVVVGYPAVATPPTTPAPPVQGMAALRRQVRTLRYLVVACLALLVLLVAGLGLALAGSRAQLDDLSAQVTALGEKADAAVQAAAAPAQSSGQAEASGPTQLGPAPELTAATIPAGADATGAILVGNPEATNIVEVYVDYQCPYCQKWEAEVGSILMDAARQPGSNLLVKQYNLAFLGEASPDLNPAGASARAASAAACVVNHDGADVFVDFSRAVFAAADPSEPPTQFTAPALTEFAIAAGASPAAIACIEAEENVPFVAATTQAGFGRGVGGTPTVVVNGQTLANPFTDPALAQLVGRTAEGRSRPAPAGGQDGAMTRRTPIAAALAGGVAVLALSACSPTTVATSDAVAPRTVSVSATGQADAVPDAAKASITVEVTDPGSAQTAQQDAARAATDVLAALTGGGVAEADIATQGISVAPAYNYTSDGGQQLLGYRAAQTFTVTLRDLATAGATLDAAVAAGGNTVRVDSVSPYVTDPSKAASAARAQAVAIAQSQAEQYAELLGFQLGDVASVSESSSATAPPPIAYADAAAASPERVPTPIEPGTTQVSVTLNVPGRSSRPDRSRPPSSWCRSSCASGRWSC